MAALTLREDQVNQQLILEASLWPRLVSLFGNLGWVVVVGIFILVPSIANGRFDPESLIIFLVILLFSVAPAARGLFTASIKIERANRLVTRTTQFIFIPIRSSSLSFNEISNIQVEHYRGSSRYARELYRVNALDRAGNRILLNWDGKRDEMFDLAHKLAAIMGAPLLDHTAQAVDMTSQMIEQVRKLGLPLPQETQAKLESADEASGQSPQPSVVDSMPPTTSPEEPLPSAADVVIHQDSRSLDMGELERRVASDPMDSDARYALAREYHARGQLDRAVELYQATLQVDTLNAEAQSDLGVAFQERGKRTEAEAAYRRAIALDPFSFHAHLNLALLLRSMNRAAEASQEFFQARQNARGNDETRLAEIASTGARLDPQLSNR